MRTLALIFAHFPPFCGHGAKAIHTIQPFLIAQQKAVSPRHAVYGKMNATPLFMRQVQQKAARSPFDLPGALYYLQDKPSERQDRQCGKGFLSTGSLSLFHDAHFSILVFMPDFFTRNHHRGQFPRFRDRPRLPPVKPPTKTPRGSPILAAPYAPGRIPQTGCSGVINGAWRARIG